MSNDNVNVVNADYYGHRAAVAIDNARRALMAQHADVMGVVATIHRATVASLVRDAVMSVDVCRWSVDLTRDPFPAMLDAMAERAMGATHDTDMALEDLTIGVAMQAKVTAEWCID